MNLLCHQLAVHGHIYYYYNNCQSTCTRTTRNHLSVMFPRRVLMYRVILHREERIKVLQIPETLPNIFEIVIRIRGIQIGIFAVCFFTRAEQRLSVRSR